jgi:hypothetical protein
VTSARDTLLPILTAAERAGIDIAQIHRWEDIGGIEVQRRGLQEFVSLDRVMSLSASARRNDPNSRRGALRARLADAAVATESVANLQKLARDRSGSQT